MPRPHSEDLREKVINSIHKGLSVKDAVKIFQVGKTSIYSWLKKENETGSYKSFDRNPGRKETLNNQHKEAISALIKEKPAITLMQFSQLREQVKI